MAQSDDGYYPLINSAISQLEEAYKTLGELEDAIPFSPGSQAFDKINDESYLAMNSLNSLLKEANALRKKASIYSEQKKSELAEEEFIKFLQLIDVKEREIDNKLEQLQAQLQNAGQNQEVYLLEEVISAYEKNGRFYVNSLT